MMCDASVLFAFYCIRNGNVLGIQSSSISDKFGFLLIDRSAVFNILMCNYFLFYLRHRELLLNGFVLDISFSITEKNSN